MSTDSTVRNAGKFGWRLGMVAMALLALMALWLLWPSAPIAVAQAGTAKSQNDSAAGQRIERGRYLAKLGNCQACHSLAGQAPFAGGTAIETPFGVVYGSNLTPSAKGIGAWSEADFWRALHHGQAPDGRWLIPAFPYTNTTHISRDDSDALYAFFRSLPPDETPSRVAQLRWPYNTQAALKLWRLMYFKEAQAQTVSPLVASDEALRGRYLANALGHCSACHAGRDRWGGAGEPLSLNGGEMPRGWYAPSLHSRAEAGLQGWRAQDAMALLKTGRHGNHLVSGPMAEVVGQSLASWKEEDLRALVAHLGALPLREEATPEQISKRGANMKLGEKLYGKHCASCHGDKGEGFVLANGSVAYPALDGNRAVLMSSTANLVQVVLHGGFSLASPQLPQPFGMPPFMQELDDASIAAVLTYIRGSWRNRASQVVELDVLMHRGKSQN